MLARATPRNGSRPRLLTTKAGDVGQHDERMVSERRYLSQESMDLLKESALPSAPVALAKVK